MEDSSEYSDEEVGVVAGGRRLWVRGVRLGTTCGDVVTALLQDDSLSSGSKGSWVLAERWRGVERPLPGEARVLDVLNAWGDARDEVRLSLRCASANEDSGNESPAGSRRRRRRHTRHRSPPAAPADTPADRLVSVIRHQTTTLHQQLDKLRDQEKQIDHLEDQMHKTRMEKHGTNYLLESYLRDLGRGAGDREVTDSQAGVTDSQAGVTDSQAGNSDSGVGGSGTPPRRNKHKSRRERHLMREHYFTKELTDICQINADRVHQDTDSDNSSDELAKMREEIELLEKMAIINKRLHREEELIVRLNAKVKRYLDENKANSCDAKQLSVLLDRLTEEFSATAKEMVKNEEEIVKTNEDIEERLKLLEELTFEVEQEELKNQLLQDQLDELVKRKPIVLEDSYTTILDGSPEDIFYNGAPYQFDTLV